MTKHNRSIPHVSLRPNVEIPQLGFGVFQIPPVETAEVVARALTAGYRPRHRRRLSQRGRRRTGDPRLGARRERGLRHDQVLQRRSRQREGQAAFKQSLERLELEHIDLYLIHWPVPAHDLYVETWQAFIELQAEGLVRAIGVSNFQPAHLERIIAETGDAPRSTRSSCTPTSSRPACAASMTELGIVTEAWSPLGQGLELDDPVIVEIAEAHAKTPPRRSSAGTCSSATS